MDAAVGVEAPHGALGVGCDVGSAHMVSATAIRRLGHTGREYANATPARHPHSLGLSRAACLGAMDCCVCDSGVWRPCSIYGSSTEGSNVDGLTCHSRNTVWRARAVRVLARKEDNGTMPDYCLKRQKGREC